MKRLLMIVLMAGCISLLGGCAQSSQDDIPAPETEEDLVTEGKEEYRGFLLDNVLHSEEGEIHYNVYIPDSYAGSSPYALYMTLPGYEGLYFQGVGENLRSEEFGFTAHEYIPEYTRTAIPEGERPCPLSWG